MHCRNCSNEVSEKAVACPKCGLNPNSENKFCPDCGSETGPKQVICTKCGISLEKKSFSIDTSNMPAIDIKAILKSKAFKAAVVIAVIATGIYAYLSWASHLRLGKAQELITEQFKSSESVTQPIQHGRIEFSGYGAGKQLSIARQLADKKIITCVRQQESNGYGYYYNTNIYQIDITPEGAKYKTGDSTDSEGRQFYMFKAYDKQFDPASITDFKESKDAKKATLNYYWKYVNCTPIGAVMLNVGGTENIAPIHTYMLFEKNDQTGDWRITNKYNNTLFDEQKPSKNYMEDIQDRLLRRSGNGL